MKSVVLGWAGVCIAAAVSAVSGAEAPGIERQFRQQAERELDWDVAMFWSHLADFTERDLRTPPPPAHTWLLGADVRIARAAGVLPLRVGKELPGLTPIAAAFEFFLAASPERGLLLGVPPSKRSIFERHLAQLPPPDPERGEVRGIEHTKASLRETILDRGWQTWAVIVLPFTWDQNEPGAPPPLDTTPTGGVDGKTEKVDVSYGRRKRSFTVEELEKAIGRSVTDRPASGGPDQAPGPRPNRS